VEDEQARLFGVRPVRLREIEAAVVNQGRWQHFVEYRMGAGANLHVERNAERTGYQVYVEWGSQKGEAQVESIQRAVEVAYRIGQVFYETRRDSEGEIL
jgi:hypothetical protein